MTPLTPSMVACLQLRVLRDAAIGLHNIVRTLPDETVADHQALLAEVQAMTDRLKSVTKSIRKRGFKWSSELDKPRGAA